MHQSSSIHPPTHLSIQLSMQTPSYLSINMHIHTYIHHYSPFHSSFLSLMIHHSFIISPFLFYPPSTYQDSFDYLCNNASFIYSATTSQQYISLIQTLLQPTCAIHQYMKPRIALTHLGKFKWDPELSPFLPDIYIYSPVSLLCLTEGSVLLP